MMTMATPPFEIMVFGCEFPHNWDHADGVYKFYQGDGMSARQWLQFFGGADTKNHQKSLSGLRFWPIPNSLWGIATVLMQVETREWNSWQDVYAVIYSIIILVELTIPESAHVPPRCWFWFSFGLRQISFLLNILVFKVPAQILTDLTGVKQVGQVKIGYIFGAT